MQWPRISVVTPSFNQAQYLEQTLDSVAQQHYPNLEHIVIDGGSSDGSVEILERRSSDLTYWVSEPDNGQTDALIKGFARATGEVLCWLNSDDLFEPTTLREVGTWFASHPHARVVYGDATWVDSENRILRRNRQHHFNRFVWLYHYNYLSQPSTFWRADLYREVGGLDPAFQLAMDGDLWIRFAERTRLHHVRRLWSRERSYPEQKNKRLRAQSDREDRLIRERYMGKEAALVVRAKKVAAVACRVAFKTAQGCYW